MTSLAPAVPSTADGWSAYDEAVPTVRGLPHVVAATDRLRRERAAPEASLDVVRDVVVVVSSSRGGSTVFAELLRRTPGLLHLRAEVNPAYALAGLHDGADRRAVLEAELLRDVGRPATGPVGSDRRRRLVLDIAWRLAVQWPAAVEALAVDELVAVVDRRVAPEGEVHDPAATVLQLLHDLRRRGVPVDPWYHDLPADQVAEAFPTLPQPVGPPAPAVVEMPPFVSLDRWAHATAAELAAGTLVVSTPRLSYRLDHLRDLFPSARLRVVHLTRSPGPAVNGLVDGWLHRGFFTCPVPVELAIAGYSDVVPGGRSWWCYDLPPDWEDWADRPLAEVAAHQWRSAHEAALDATARLRLDVLRVRSEAITTPAKGRGAVLDELASWLGVAAVDLRRAAVNLPVLMATAPPAPDRWRSRAAALAPVLRDERTRAVARALELPDPLGELG